MASTINLSHKGPWPERSTYLSHRFTMKLLPIGKYTFFVGVSHRLELTEVQ